MIEEAGAPAPSCCSKSELEQMSANLTTTQVRCAELEEEVRTLRQNLEGRTREKCVFLNRAEEAVHLVHRDSVVGDIVSRGASSLARLGIVSRFFTCEQSARAWLLQRFQESAEGHVLGAGARSRR